MAGPVVSWLQLADIVLASGARSSFKIEADDLALEELQAAAALLAKILPPFGTVSGVPRGGGRLATALAFYATEGPLLIVDDVWTTGGSMMRHRATFPDDELCIGVVLFARGPVPPSVTALFTLHEGLWSA